MTKKQIIDYLDKNYDWFEKMQLPLGHHSWWYTNRKPEDCINVKLHAWVDTDKVKARLSSKQNAIIDTLSIDLDEWCNDLVWSDYGMVEQAREDLLEELKAEYSVSDIEYGGRSGGWMAIIYKWDGAYSDYDNGIYTYAEIRDMYNVVRKAIAEHDKVTALVLQRKRELEKAIEDIDNYIEQIGECLENKLEAEATRAKRVLALS